MSGLEVIIPSILSAGGTGLGLSLGGAQASSSAKANKQAAINNLLQQASTISPNPSLNTLQQSIYSQSNPIYSQPGSK